MKPIESQDSARLAPLLDIPTDGSWLLTQVSDTGIGIPDQLMPYIFERYYQTPEGATHQNGSGIGLYFCRGLVELHHGAIRAIHNPDADSGTSFHFLLPIEKAAYRPDELSQAIVFEQAPKPKESVSVAAIDTPSPLPTDDHRPTVLVVDDDTEEQRHRGHCLAFGCHARPYLPIVLLTAKVSIEEKQTGAASRSRLSS